MKLLSSSVAAPVVLAALSILAGCSSDNSPAGVAGAGPGGASFGGKTGSAGSGGSMSAGGASGAAAGGAAGGVSAAGSGGAGTAGGAAVEASFATVKGIIQLSCFGNGCHGQEGNPLIMDINDNAKLYTTLTTHVTENCGKLVNTTAPQDSALVKLLKADCGTPPNVTPRMPFQMCFEGDTDYPCVSPENIAAIQAWISNGAKQQ